MHAKQDLQTQTRCSERTKDEHAQLRVQRPAPPRRQRRCSLGTPGAGTPVLPAGPRFASCRKAQHASEEVTQHPCCAGHHLFGVTCCGGLQNPAGAQVGPQCGSYGHLTASAILHQRQKRLQAREEAVVFCHLVYIHLRSTGSKPRGTAVAAAAAPAVPSRIIRPVIRCCAHGHGRVRGHMQAAADTCQVRAAHLFLSRYCICYRGTL